MTHNRFKLFTGEMKNDKHLGDLRSTIENYISSNNIAPKSIGIEYLEKQQRVIITLGYSIDEKGYGAKLELASLGKIDIDSNDFSSLERSIEKAASERNGIICHELFIDEDGEFYMIFMVKA